MSVREKFSTFDTWILTQYKLILFGDNLNVVDPVHRLSAPSFSFISIKHSNTKYKRVTSLLGIEPLTINLASAIGDSKV